MTAHDWQPCALCGDTFYGRRWACEGCRKWAEDMGVLLLFGGALVAFVIVAWGPQL